MTPEIIIEQFNKWYKEELRLTNAGIQSMCCLSTVGLDGFPNARFVTLKDVADNQFIITGALNSRKGIEIEANNKVTLTFWWTQTERQVRVQGRASRISNEVADKYFSDRNRDSQIVSIISNQGQVLDSEEKLMREFETKSAAFENKPLERPENWGGYAIAPVRVEFLEFKSTRLHNRTLYQHVNGEWVVQQLQP